ncbi:hypothetical protein EPO33_03565 [Patescibacteria group bacterium]|nr:MAG: hypothetical protein EPO33_03565 [Patescibacteria group bacterium]
MRTLSVLFAVCCAACSTERVEIVHERAVCESDRACDDGDETTADSCNVAGGFCDHERSVVGGLCESTADCDDGDAATVDACEGGDCHHARDITAPFDPAAPERQDAQLICETPAMRDVAPEGALTAELILEGCGEPAFWNETGYRMTVVIRGVGLDESVPVRVTPQLRVGDPGDRYHVTVSTLVASGLSTMERVEIAGDFTVPEIEAGFEVTVPGSPSGPVVGGAQVILRFQPIGAVRSRTIQWALPRDGVTRLDAGPSVHTWPASSFFMRVPRHGFLRINEGSGGEAQCTGELRTLDVPPSGYINGGLVREESDPEVFYLTDFDSPRHLFRFQGLRGAIDWFGWWETTCAQVTVVPDGSLDDPEFVRLTVGLRPGTSVAWYDSIGARHFGYTDRNFVIRDPGVATSGVACSRYPAWGGDLRGCELDITSMLAGYTVMSATEPYPDLDQLRAWSIQTYADPPRP